MFAKLSIPQKAALVFIAALVMVLTGFFVGLHDLKLKVLRNEASAVANQVVAFRSWVAKAGMVWVDRLSADFHDFLAKRPSESGEYFFGKNPALATRELSKIVKDTSVRATFRVTSDNYRYPANKPDAFESKAIEIFKTDKERHFYEAIEDGNYRYAQPIYVKPACLKCHGDPKDAPPEVIEKYGDKKAFGYKVGDVRGVISVKLPDITLKEAAMELVNPITLGLFILAFGISLAYVQIGVIRRIKDLTRRTESIAKGELGTELPFRSNARDEIDILYRAVDLLRKSLQVAMRRIKG